MYIYIFFFFWGGVVLKQFVKPEVLLSPTLFVEAPRLCEGYARTAGDLGSRGWCWDSWGFEGALKWLSDAGG